MCLAEDFRSIHQAAGEAQGAMNGPRGSKAEETAFPHVFFTQICLRVLLIVIGKLSSLNIFFMDMLGG